MFGKFFQGIKNKAVSALLEKQLKNVPPEQRDMIMHAFEKHPDIFQKIAKEIEEKKKSGMNELYASIEVMKKYQPELQKILMEK